MKNEWMKDAVMTVCELMMEERLFSMKEVLADFKRVSGGALLCGKRLITLNDKLCVCSFIIIIIFL